MNEPLRRLHELGQSIWYDNIRRALLDSGGLREYVDEFAVTGVTSNPSIFEHAISGSSDYDGGLRDALDRGTTDPEELFWDLAVRDIQDAADVLRDVHDATEGVDGFVSLELPPRLSRDAAGSVHLGTELFARLDRPNVMIKVPGTREGAAAIEELIYRGVNVNVTLLFSLAQWQAVSNAYVRGLERRAVEGSHLRVASVASYFISRIDGKANDQLPDSLHNRLGVELHVLDSDDPAAIRRVERELPLDRTLFIASSKSGTTAETRSLLEYFWRARPVPDHFAVITDPGTPLAKLGNARGFRAVFEARPDLGGRYAALSHFGLVPAALAGVDVAELLHRARRMAAASADCVPAAENAGLLLGAMLAGAVRAGRDKLTLVIDERFATFGVWIEQLIAESTGKQGIGIVPIVGEPLGTPEVYGNDRLFIGIGVHPTRLDSLASAGHPVAAFPLSESAELGAEVLRWEIATALAGAVLGINPFDQPDVEAAKDAARAALDAGVQPVEPRAPEELLGLLVPGDYLAIQAYVDPEAEVVSELERIRLGLRDRYRVATTLGIGPRYLHSTGQLHKGGPDSGVFLQIAEHNDDDLAIPGERFGFATLESAQAAGDLQALLDRGRRAGRVRLEDLQRADPQTSGAEAGSTGGRNAS